MNDQTADLSSIDSFHVGRRRKPNFTDHEVLYIIDQYDNYKECLHSREASKSVIAQKQAIWKQITDNLNTNYPQVERTVEDSSDKVDSPSSDLGNGISVQLDSPGDESASLLGNEDNSPSPITNYQLTSNIQSYQPAHLSTVAISNNGQISKRTLDKRRKLLKSSVNQQVINNTSKSSYGQPQQQQQQQQQQNSLRYESLIKRKRTLELTSQRLVYDKERLLIERKNLDIKLATNECENERIAIEKRRTELALQKLQSDISLSTNGNHNLSDQEDHEDNNSLDDMSDINE
ncbi:unnamed protein product [Adineta steineri]|uniref:Myb/SANT-like DNA-binding domain-containing protein n=1 Tax=Adineta steineri TaxID=433720 RepID=A0A819INN0_9BILA|nr:unnamed protein product [Adineta steineri]